MTGDMTGCSGSLQSDATWEGSKKNLCDDGIEIVTKDLTGLLPVSRRLSPSRSPRSLKSEATWAGGYGA